MDDQLISGLLQQYGSVGLIAGLAGYALRQLHAELVASQEKRIADAQAATTQLLKLVDEQHRQLSILTQAIDGSAEANHELRTLVDRALAGERSRLIAPPRRGP